MTESLFKDHIQYNIMTLSGQGHVMADPNVAIIRLGVQTTGDNIETIQSENAQISQAVLDSLNQLGIDNIRTFQYVIEKNYEYENGIRVDKGFIVRNIFEISLYDMSQVGYVIDTAVDNGANVVEFISFELDDPSIYYQEALNLAIVDAQTKARSIARQLGFSMEPIPIKIVENSNAPMPRSQQFSIREGMYATPIEPGQKQIVAFVTIDFIY